MSKAKRRAARLERKRRAQELKLKQQGGDGHIVQASALATRQTQDQTPPTGITPAAALTPTATRHRVRKLLTRFLGFILAVATLTGLFSLWPRVQILPPIDPADPFQPYGVPFLIQNSGNLPIYSVEIQCMPHDFQFGVIRDEQTTPGPAIRNLRFVADEISPGESRPFVCDVLRMQPDTIIKTQYADIGVLLRSRPIRFIPLNWPAKTQVFITSPEPTGQLRWREYKPLLESAPAKYPAR